MKKTTKTYHVTQKHIDQGRPKDWYVCPVALAMNEQGPGCNYRVGDDEIWWDEAYYRDSQYIFKSPFNASHCVLSPKSVRLFVREFDMGYKMIPFSFEL